MFHQSVPSVVACRENEDPEENALSFSSGLFLDEIPNNFLGGGLLPFYDLPAHKAIKVAP